MNWWAIACNKCGHPYYVCSYLFVSLKGCDEKEKRNESPHPFFPFIHPLTHTLNILSFSKGGGASPALEHYGKHGGGGGVEVEEVEMVCLEYLI